MPVDEAFDGGYLTEDVHDFAVLPRSDGVAFSEDKESAESKLFQERVIAAQHHASSLVTLIKGLRADKKKLQEIARHKDKMIEELQNDKPTLTESKATQSMPDPACADEPMAFKEMELQSMKASLMAKIIREQELETVVRENEEVIKDLNERLQVVREIEHKMLLKYSEMEMKNSTVSTENELVNQVQLEAQKQQQELQDQIKKLRAANEFLEKRICEMDNTLASRETLLRNSDEEMTLVIAKFEALQEKSAEFDESVKRFKEKIHHDESEIRVKTNKIAELTQLLTEKNKELTAMKSQFEKQLYTTVQEKVTLISELEKKVAVLTNINFSEAEQNKKLSTQNKQLLSEYNNLKQQDIGREQLRQELSKSLATLQHRLQETEQINQALLREKLQFAEERLKLGNDIQRLEKTNTSLLSEADQLKHTVRQTLADSSRLKSEQAQMLEMSNKLRLNCEELSLARERACKEHAVAQAENNRLQKALDSLHSEKQFSFKQQDVHSKTVQQLEVVNAQLKRENQHLEQERNTLIVDKERLMRLNDELQSVAEESHSSQLGLKEDIVRIVDEYERSRERQIKQRVGKVQSEHSQFGLVTTADGNRELPFRSTSRQASSHAPLALSDATKLMDDYKQAESIYARTTSSHLLRTVRSMQRMTRNQANRESTQDEEQLPTMANLHALAGMHLREDLNASFAMKFSN